MCISSGSLGVASVQVHLLIFWVQDPASRQVKSAGQPGSLSDRIANVQSYIPTHLTSDLLRPRPCKVECADELRGFGFTATQLKSAGTSLADVMKAGYPLADLKGTTFPVRKLRVAGFDAVTLGSQHSIPALASWCG